MRPSISKARSCWLARSGTAAVERLRERGDEVVLVDRQRRIRYAGRIDDRYKVRGVMTPGDRRPELADAIRDLVAGREIRTPRTKAVGCPLDAHDPRQGPDVEPDVAAADFPAPLDQDDTEFARRFEHVANERPVPGLEDVEWEHLVGEQHPPEREHRDSRGGGVQFHWARTASTSARNR